jgi:hypothetical protein
MRPTPVPTTQIVTAKRFGKQYVLYQCGTPDPSSLPPGAAPGVTPGMPSFEIPLYSVAVTDTTVNGFLVGGQGARGEGAGQGAAEGLPAAGSNGRAVLQGRRRRPPRPATPAQARSPSTAPPPPPYSRSST